MSYGPQEKFLARIKQDPDLNRETALTLPRIGFEIDKLSYDGGRKLGTLIKNARSDSSNNNSLTTQWMSTPYNIGFGLSVYAKTQDDATKIVEQIIPFFRPHWVIRARINEPFQTVYNIPIVLDSVDQSDTYDDSFTERRAVVWDFHFTMKTFFFGPASTSKIIKIANINFIIPGSTTEMANTAALELFTESEWVSVQPGMDANGVATTNVAVTVPYSNINIDDDWGFATTLTTIEDQ